MAKADNHAAFLMGLVLILALVVNAGCEPEMPVPPPKAFGGSAEEDFEWAMERMKHAMDLFRPARSLGLSMKRELDYELIRPTAEEAHYTARVTISTRTVFHPDMPSSQAQRRRDEARKEAAKIKLDNPYKLPGEESSGNDAIPLPDVPLAELEHPEIADPRVPTQRLEEEQEYLLEYVDGQWQLKTDEVPENERIWFDYALEQGQFAPGAEPPR